MPADFPPIAVLAALVAVPLLIVVGALIARRSRPSAAAARQEPRGVQAAPAEPVDQAATTQFHDYDARPTILTDPEQVLFRRLVDALPDRYVLAQVQLSQAIRPSTASERQAALNRINRKSLDYLVIDRATTPLVAIELDDATHRRPDRQKADEVKTSALAAASLPLLRYSVDALPDAARISTDVATAIETAPPAPSPADTTL